MGTSLYVLANEYKDALEKLSDSDLPDEVIKDTLDGLGGELEVKARNVALFSKNLEVTELALKEAEKGLANRRKLIEKKRVRLEEYLLSNMLLTGTANIESPLIRIRVKDCPPSVVIDAESQIPQEFMRQPETPPPAPDKKAIAESIKIGHEVPGCHLERRKTLEIKN